MLALLFNVLIVVAIIGIIAFCAKYPNGKVFVFTFLGIGLTVFTAYAGVQLNYYYKASGGVYGYITGLFKPNEVTVENAEFTFSNMELKQINGKDEYGAYITTDDIVSFENGKAYGLFINNMPAKTTSFSTDYIQAQYSYAFYDNQRELLMQDTLFFNFAFHTNSTNIEIFSKGGSEAVKYWNYWFNKNVFVASIDQVNYVQSDSFNYRDLQLNNDESMVAYYYKADLKKYEIVQNGSKLTEPEIKAPEGEKINGWTVNGEMVDFDTYIVSNSINVYADWEDLIYIELRSGTPAKADYEVIDSKWYSRGTLCNDVVKLDLQGINENILKKTGYRWFDCNANDIEFSAKVEDLANGIMYVDDLEFREDINLYTNDFDSSSNQYEYNEFSQTENFDLAKISEVWWASGAEFKDLSDGKETSIMWQECSSSDCQINFSGTKTWTTSDNKSTEIEFSFGMVLNSDFSMTFSVSDNLRGSKATGTTLGTLGTRISLTVIIEFSTRDIFYLV